jgi:putative hemolysin
MKKVISQEHLAKATGMKPGNPLVALISSVSGINKLNKFYYHAGEADGVAFIDQVLANLEIELDFKPEELERIPKTEAFVAIANHPFGALDGLILLKILHEVRPDFRVMANFLLENVPQLKELFISVNPFENHRGAYSNIKGLKAALGYLTEDQPIGLFPAGEVSSFQTSMRAVSDRKWQPSALKIIQKANVPVVPIHFDGSNSALFHLLGLLHPSLRTLALPSEFLKKKGKKIKVRIGNPIPSKDLTGFDNLEHLGRFLRAKTYALGTGVKVKRQEFIRLPISSKPEPIIPAVDKDLITQDLDRIKDLKLFTQDHFTCYLTPYSKIPNLLRELGRLREITFREVGEGTNREYDLDEYDYQYHHLILIDDKTNNVVGSYRIGMGADIMARLGRKGFYTSSLFKMSPEMDSVLEHAIELGRSFIVKEYQKHRLSLFSLWKGILFCLISNPQYRYIIGPVSISANYSAFSRGLIIEFVRKFYFNHELAQFVKPRKPFKIKSKQVDMEALVSASDSDLKKLDKLIGDIEPEYFTVPVLLKKYLQQNARILAFNRDPKFSDALDGLMILDLQELPPETVENLKREFLES